MIELRTWPEGVKWIVGHDPAVEIFKTAEQTEIEESVRIGFAMHFKDRAYVNERLIREVRARVQFDLEALNYAHTQFAIKIIYHKLSDWVEVKCWPLGAIGGELEIELSQLPGYSEAT